MPWNERVFCHKYFWMLYFHFLVLESNLSPLNTKMLNFMSCLLNAFFYDWPHLLTPRVYVWVSSSMFIWSLEGILLLSRVSAAHWALGLWVSRKWVVAGTGTTPTSCSIPHHTYADAALLLHQTPPIKLLIPYQIVPTSCPLSLPKIFCASSSLRWQMCCSNKDHCLFKLQASGQILEV